VRNLGIVLGNNVGREKKTRVVKHAPPHRHCPWPRTLLLSHLLASFASSKRPFALSAHSIPDRLVANDSNVGYELESEGGWVFNGAWNAVGFDGLEELALYGR
jgi:hypothetical protein